MEYSAILAVFLLGMTVSILSYYYRLRRYGVFNQVKAEFTDYLKEHQQKGDADQFVEDFASGKISVYKRRKQLSTLMWTGLSMIVAVLLSVLMLKFLTLGIWIRAIFVSLFVSPFLYLVSASIAEEVDENRISSFEKSVREQINTSKEDGTVGTWISKFLS